MVADEEQKVLSKLEGMGKLPHDLPNTVDELNENRRPVAVLVAIVPVTNTLQMEGQNCLYICVIVFVFNVMSIHFLSI